MKSIQDIVRRCLDIEAQSISPIARVEAALEKMERYDLGALLVMDFTHLLGIFSERDYARKILLKARSSLTTPIYEVMSTNLISVTPDFRLSECLALMSRCHIRHLPVLNGERVMALLGIEDIAFALIENDEFMIDELTTYITGSHDVINEPPKLSKIFESYSRH